MAAGVLFRVTAAEPLCEGVKRFRLAPLNRKPVTPFEPGAHIRVSVKDAASGLSGSRSYSLTSRTEDGEAYEITVAITASEETDAASISRFLHTSVAPGRVVTVNGPHNGFRLADESLPCVLIAGGIGITPLLAMARRLEAEGRPFELFYSGKSKAAMPYLQELESFRHGRCTVITTASPPLPRLDIQAVLDAAPAAAHVYVCGPRGMTDAVFAAAREAGWAAGRVHAESFDSGAASGDDAFTVELAKSGRQLRVAAGETILDALLAAGVALDYDCRHGSCGRCTQAVLRGEPDHRDALYAGSAEASQAIRICVSRAKSALLVLDL
jgi:ferredoxin-NADP reductase